MKTLLTGIIAALLLSGCATDLKLLALKADVGRGGSIGKYAILTLSPSAYPIMHTIPAVHEINFPQLAVKALEEAITKERKSWKASYPSATAGADSTSQRILMARKEDFNSVTADEKAALEKLADALDTRYFFVLESASIKDVSSPQVPKSLIIGVCLQLWDFQTGELVFRAREVSRTVGYMDENFKKLLNEALYDLLADMISPLAKK